MTGPEMRQARREIGMTQAELAKDAGISATMVSHYENERFPVPKWMPRYLAALRLERRFPGILALILQ